MAKNDSSPSVASSTVESPSMISKIMYDMVNGMLMNAGIGKKGPQNYEFNEPMDISPPPPPPNSQDMLVEAFGNQSPGVNIQGFKDSPGKEGSVRLVPGGWKPSGTLTEGGKEYEPSDLNDLVPMGANLFAHPDIAQYPGLKEMAQPAINKWYAENPPEEEYKRKGLK